jgi:hypothetical protein
LLKGIAVVPQQRPILVRAAPNWRICLFGFYFRNSGMGAINIQSLII